MPAAGPAGRLRGLEVELQGLACCAPISACAKGFQWPAALSPLPLLQELEAELLGFDLCASICACVLGF